MDRMHTMVRTVINKAWLRSLRKDYVNFLTALTSVPKAQESYLMKLLRDNACTEYGKQYRFNRITSLKEFQARVPVTEYEDYLPFIERISRDKEMVLTRDRVMLFKPSSGTCSASKYIPYTAALKADFWRGIAPWVTSLHKSIPQLTSGLAYWSISPPIKKERFYGKVPVGFDHDAEYLDFFGKKLHYLVTATPKNLLPGMAVDAFFRETLLCLLSCRDLSLISVWSPSFLTNILDFLMDGMETLLDQLAESTYPGASGRMKELRLLSCVEKEEALLERIWPSLSLISCWTDGPCETYIRKMKEYFPTTRIQGKGLIATEAFVSFPLSEGTDPVLAVRSHFFEFRDAQTGDIRLAHELTEGRKYSVIVTTGGGLYRYILNDIILVTGFILGAPTFRFVAKEKAVSDLFGEKLNAAHVQNCLKGAFAAADLTPSFFLLAPFSGASHAPSYVLFFEGIEINRKHAAILVKELDRRLRENFHYDNCRDIAQLASPRLFKVDGDGSRGSHIFTNEMLRRGLKAGDIKPSVLDRGIGWEEIFPGRFVDAG